ncbi:hypothetical protein CGLO_17951 [Colletotrichum gloeosporioides Cg-14]|uniref:Short chain dehydrogenase n=1 Tax=Colletotrichum gloeosporioides (strain Cg-14) TaxID=1237896 RepID=T0KVN5_COLGC|nr:hypothetical protein CGLO_17951 [Colletotrichum gloeosporioides Cg-14]
MDTALEHFGTVDVFVNNSGFNGEEALPHEMTLEQWQNVIDVNITVSIRKFRARSMFIIPLQKAE